MKFRVTPTLTLVLGIMAGIGLVALVIYSPPTSWGVVLALFLVLVAVMGISTPIWRMFLQKILPKQKNYVTDAMSWRFGLWTGIFAASVLLLRILGFANNVLFLAVFALLIMMEMFWQQNFPPPRSSGRSRR